MFLLKIIFYLRGEIERIVITLGEAAAGLGDKTPPLPII
jgi:hypothetical protein